MARQLLDLLTTLQVEAPQEVGRLQVFGLKWADDEALPYATLDEALKAGYVEVTEINEGGSVPLLKVINKGEEMVLLLAGEQLIGAKQNRVLNADIMAAAKSELPIPVSCVEAGRWHYKSPKFASAGTMSHARLRQMMSADAHGAYRAMGAPASNQGKVWNEVARKLQKLGSASPSSALHQAYQDQETPLKKVEADVRAPEGCNGAAFVVAGRIAGADLFDSSEALRKYWPKLIRAYALDALEETTPAAPVSREAVRAWLETAAQAKSEPFKSPGLGYDVRLEGKELVGAGLVLEDHPVHVELFATMPAPPDLEA
jgi:hypothetical protein